MTEQTATTPPLTEFNGFELAIGSVFGVRWFGVDRDGRLRGRTYKSIWKPGENVAKCRQDEETAYTSWTLGGLSFPTLSVKYSGPISHTAPSAASLSEAAVEERIDLSHPAPGDVCPCGFYAFAEGCDDRSYSEGGLMGVVECYGRVVLGTKGMRAEKARIVGLAGANKRTRELYPEVRHYRKPRWMLRRFDLIQPARRTPETDPNFWGTS